VRSFFSSGGVVLFLLLFLVATKGKRPERCLCFVIDGGFKEVSFYGWLLCSNI
jgi:hypothetical protein